MGRRKGDETRSASRGIPPEDLELWAKLLSLGKELAAFRRELESYQAKVRGTLLSTNDATGEE
ncbi:MAG: hypothetical protein JRN20_07465 [Nitrososphaerota archaeon]|nr:hypothetical protein [Nitrososphaerota archaeon]